jgi:hypothetical protein
MNTIKIDNKKYVVIPQKEYEALQKLAASKKKPEKSMTIEAARAYSKKRIQQWAKEK